MTDTTTGGLSPAEIASKAEEGDMDMALLHVHFTLSIMQAVFPVFLFFL